MPAIPRSSAPWASCRTGAITLVEIARRRRPHRAGRSVEPRLCHADDPVRRRHARDRRGADAALSRRSSRPHKEDICYATTNRQEAVKRVAPQVDAMIVVGSPNSSNSQRLREVAERAGCPLARLVLRADDIDWSEFARYPPARRHGRRIGSRGAGRGDHRRLRRALRPSRSRRSRRPTRTCSSRCRGSLRGEAAE